MFRINPNILSKLLIGTAGAMGAGVGYKVWDVYDYNKKRDELMANEDIARTLRNAILYNPDRTLSKDELNQIAALSQYANSVTRSDLKESLDYLRTNIDEVNMGNQFNDLNKKMNAILAKKDLSRDDVDELINLSVSARGIRKPQSVTDARYNIHTEHIDRLVDQGSDRFHNAQLEQDLQRIEAGKRRALEAEEAEQREQAEAEAKKPLNILKGYYNQGMNYVNQGLDYVKAHPWQVGIPVAALGALGLGAIYYNRNKKKKKESD